MPFVVTLAIADGYRGTVNLYDDDAENPGIVLRDPAAFRELRVDGELGIIAVVGIYIAGGS